jgi:hypothetical protein
MNYFVFQKEMENNAYDPVKDEIKILLNDGKLTDIAQASDNFNISALSKPVKKILFICTFFLIYVEILISFLIFNYK